MREISEALSALLLAENQKDVKSRAEEIKKLVAHMEEAFENKQHNRFFTLGTEMVSYCLENMLQSAFNKDLFCYEDIQAFKSLLITNRSLFESCIEQLEQNITGSTCCVGDVSSNALSLLLTYAVTGKNYSLQETYAEYWEKMTDKKEKQRLVNWKDKQSHTYWSSSVFRDAKELFEWGKTLKLTLTAQEILNGCNNKESKEANPKRTKQTSPTEIKAHKPKQTKEERTKQLLKTQSKKNTQKKAMVIAHLDNFRRDDGSVNIYGLAKETGVSRPTVKKYVDELNVEKFDRSKFITNINISRSLSKQKEIKETLSGSLFEEYLRKEKNGLYSFNIYKLEKDLGFSRNTIKKHLTADPFYSDLLKKVNKNLSKS